MTPTIPVWVVDDDRSVRFVLATALREAGYDGDRVRIGAGRARRARHAPPPRLLFTDVRMPGDDGLVLLDKLKHAHPQLPVIVMSAYTDIASTAGAFRGGAHEFLSKPFDLDDAVALAARALAQRDDDARQPTPAPPAPRRRCAGRRHAGDARNCSAPSAGSRRRRCRCWSPARPAPARNWSRARCIANRRARASRSWP